MINYDKFRNKPYNRSVDVLRPGTSKTDQSFQNDTDINTIVSRFMKTGVLHSPGTTQRQGFYADMTVFASDLLGAHELINRSNEAFMSLPATVRERFQNSPEKVLEFLSDSRNREEAIKLGLIPVPEVKDSSSLPVTPDQPVSTGSKAKAKTTTINDDDKA